ncbi:hypothetical protein A8B75_18755 [Sphingomonadales bacterium EhC05]|nr:hypothetical protein A8B75_18755 [Sphingomonadales bacterium EhC05]
MELKSITVTKFKKIDSIELPISALNILVGANGSGKSSILQAVHLAACLLRQAARVDPNSTSMVRVSDLDYLPSDEYWRLGHGADWGNNQNTPSSKIIFSFENEQEEVAEAYCVMRSARNAGISVSGETPEAIRSQFRGSNKFFSGFIPGISGIPNQEQKKSKRVVLKACSFGDSNVYLRNALHLLAPEQLTQIEQWLLPLLGQVKIHITFDNEKDFDISAEVEINGYKRPLELLGTGYLQLIQIFCYILLFKPKVLLVDEPDIHLHPNVQEKLAACLAEIANEKNLKILMTTHSPFIVRGAPPEANITWLENGAVSSDNKAVVELALGWGAFGKKVLVISEDAKNDFLKKIIAQWPEIERTVGVIPGRGYKHLLTKTEAQELFEALGEKFKIVVHRDRDSLTDNEVQQLQADYDSDHIKLWLTDQSDLEAYFCDGEFVSQLAGCSADEANGYLDEIDQQYQTDIRNQFNSQRKAHNEELYPAGGSPVNEAVWQAFQQRPLHGAKGKFVFGQLKNKVPNNQFSPAAIMAKGDHIELATSLRDLLTAVAQN